MGIYKEFTAIGFLSKGKENFLNISRESYIHTNMNTFVTKIISFSQQKKSYHFILPIPKNKIPRFLLSAPALTQVLLYDLACVPENQNLCCHRDRWVYALDVQLHVLQKNRNVNVVSYR